MRAMVACFFVGLVAAGCGATSEHPLCDESDAIVDERLVGWWGGEQQADGKPQQRMAVGKIAGKKAMEMVYVSVTKKGTVKVTRIPFHATKIGDHHYVNIALGSLKGTDLEAEKGYTFFRYKVEGDQLTIYAMETDAVAAAIKAGRITGTQKKGEESDADFVHLTAPKDKLRSWVAKTPDSLWKPGDNPLKRVPLKRED